MTHPAHLWQLLEAACTLRNQVILQHGLHSDEWLQADIAVKKCQRALTESLKPSSPDEEPITLPRIPVAR